MLSTNLNRMPTFIAANSTRESQQTVSSDDIEQLQLDLASLAGWKLQAVS
jgi:hypothetical protein